MFATKSGIKGSHILIRCRGAFHAHCILIFDADKVPYIANDDMARLWKWGFTKTKSLKGTNPGIYCTAYLCDMPLEQAIQAGTTKINGKTVVLDSMATIINGRTVVPLRFVAESTGAIVKWNGTTKTVSISTGTKIAVTKPVVTEPLKNKDSFTILMTEEQVLKELPSAIQNYIDTNGFLWRYMYPEMIPEGWTDELIFAMIDKAKYDTKSSTVLMGGIEMTMLSGDMLYMVEYALAWVRAGASDDGYNLFGKYFLILKKA